MGLRLVDVEKIVKEAQASNKEQKGEAIESVLKVMATWKRKEREWVAGCDVSLAEPQGSRKKW